MRLDVTLQWKDARKFIVCPFDIRAIDCRCNSTGSTHKLISPEYVKGLRILQCVHPEVDPHIGSSRMIDSHVTTLIQA